MPHGEIHQRIYSIPCTPTSLTIEDILGVCDSLNEEIADLRVEIRELKKKINKGD
jgi:hypothetical protein